MYTARSIGRARTSQRRAFLEDAITHVLGLARLGLVPKEAITYALKAARYQTFPTGTWTVSPSSFEQRVMEILQRANATRAAGVAEYGAEEVRIALIERGYKPGTLATVAPPTLTPVPPDDSRDGIPTTVLPTTLFPPPSDAREPRPYILPVVIPRSPVFEELPTFTAPKKSNLFLWIAGLLAFYAIAKADGHLPRSPARSRRKKRVSGTLGAIGGATANCVVWQELESQKTGGLLWRCMTYAPACAPGENCTAPERLPVKKKKQLRVCAETKKVKPTSPHFLVKSISRCARFIRVCRDGACLDETMDTPPPSPGHGMNVKRIVRSLAKDMAEERNDLEEAAGKVLGREILDRGGIRSYRKGLEREEYREIPIFMRRKTGLPLDEMASEMGYEDDQALMRDIKREYPGTTKKQRLYSASDFMLEAEGVVWRDINAGMVSGLGQDLFPGLRRELALEVQDLATSDDPLEIHLQRQGWKLKRVTDLQASIAEKSVPDMFTGEMEPFTAAEEMLRRDVEAFFHSKRVYRKSLGSIGMQTFDPDAGTRLITTVRDGHTMIEKSMSAQVMKELRERGIVFEYRNPDRDIQFPRGPAAHLFFPNHDEAFIAQEIADRIFFGESGAKKKSLGAIQREMWDPEQLEFPKKPAEGPGKKPQQWFFIPKGMRIKSSYYKPQHITATQMNERRDYFYRAERAGNGKLYSVPGKNKTESLKRLNEHLHHTAEYAEKFPGRQNPNEPAYHNVTRLGDRGFRIVPLLVPVRQTMSDFWFFLPKNTRKPTVRHQVQEAQYRSERVFLESAEMKKRGKLYSVTAYNPLEAVQNLKNALDKAREYRKKWAGPNPEEPPYHAYTKDLGYRVVRFTDEQAALRAREIYVARRERAKREMFDVDPMAGLMSTLQLLQTLAKLAPAVM